MQKHRDEGKKLTPLKIDRMGWKRDGYNIKYQNSKLNKFVEKQLGEEENTDPLKSSKRPTFYQLSFNYDFDDQQGEEIYFAYSFPYTFTRLSNFLKELKEDS